MPAPGPYPAGSLVYASDGMLGGLAVVETEPIPQLTTDHPLQVVRFVEDGEQFLAAPCDLRDPRMNRSRIKLGATVRWNTPLGVAAEGVVIEHTHGVITTVHVDGVGECWWPTDEIDVVA